MWNWLVPAAVSAVGGFLQNKSSAKQAADNRAFQERMSSTAAQRSAKDYQAAGFNPALAYERPASSPGGSVAPVEDVLGKGVSSGLAAKAQAAQLKLLFEQTKEAQGRAKIANAEATIADGKAAPWQLTGPGSLRDVYGRAEMSRMQQEMTLQPFQLQQLQAALALTQNQGRAAGYGLAGAKAEEEMWKSLGSLGPAFKGLMPLLRLIRPR